MTEEFHFRIADPVRIVCQGIDVNGYVLSSYNDFGAEAPVAGVEMNEEDGTYHYWKAGDGGKVYRRAGGAWVEVWPVFVEDDPIIRPHFKVFLTDETTMWSHDIVSRLPEGCKLMGAYLVDVSREVHLCSLRPSYEAWWLYTVPTEAIDDDDLIEEISMADAQDERMRYFSTEVKWAHDYGQRDDCGWVRAATGLVDSRHLWDGGDDFETYDDLIDHMLEEANANHPV
jgi:hypothetical protein